MNCPTSQPCDATPCPLCQEAGGEVVHTASLFRVVWADEPLYPGFLRLIWTEHVREFSELSSAHRSICMEAVVQLERFVLDEMGADKVNLATLGNVVPHLHWHVIPRFQDDTHFPAPVWAAVPKDADSGQGLCDGQRQILARKTELIHKLAGVFTH